LIEHGLTSAQTQYRLYGRRFFSLVWIILVWLGDGSHRGQCRQASANNLPCRKSALQTGQLAD